MSSGDYSSNPISESDGRKYTLPLEQKYNNINFYHLVAISIQELMMRSSAKSLNPYTFYVNPGIENRLEP